MAVERPVPERSLRSNWILAHILAFFLGGLAGAIAELVFFVQTTDDGVTVVGGQMFPLGLLIGFGLSIFFQGFVLRNRLNPGSWIAASFVGLFAAVGILFATGMLDRWLSNLAFFVGSSVAETFGIISGLGLALGLAQWLVLRRRLPRAGAWVSGSLLGWLVGLAIGWTFGTTAGMALAMILSAFAGGVAGGLLFPLLIVLGIGVGYSLITGNTLARLLAYRR